jgi:hypothetical protein
VLLLQRSSGTTSEPSFQVTVMLAGACAQLDN